MTDRQAETLAKAGTAPAVDDPRKPATLWQLDRGSWWYAIRRAVHNFLVDIDTDVAGTLTYCAVLSLFPALLALLTLVSVFGQGQATADWILEQLSRGVPQTVVDLLREPIVHLATAQQAGWVLLISMTLAIWGASGYVGAFGRAMNRVYDVAEGRPIWVVIPYNLLLTVGVLLFGVLFMLTVLLSGGLIRRLGGYVGLANDFAGVWDNLRYPLLIVVAMIFVAALYYATPNVRVRFRLITPGTIFALASMALAVFLFTFYVDNFGTWNATYGVVGSFIVLLLGLWLMNLALLFGAELDAELERARQLQGGIVADDVIQLPPRDDRMIKQVIADQQKFVTQAKAIRQRHQPEASAPDGPAERGGRGRRGGRNLTGWGP